jgi:hypothetical protein
MDSSNVDSVFIAGQPVKRNGRLANIDVDRLLRQADKAREALMARAGSSCRRIERARPRPTLVAPRRRTPAER